MSGCHVPDDNKEEFCIWCGESLPCGCVLAMVREVQDKQKKHWELMYSTTENLSKRISQLEQHKNQQVEENRKISRGCHEFEKKVIDQFKDFFEMFESIDVQLNELRTHITNIENNINYEQAKELIYQGAQTHLSILKLESKVKDLETGSRKPHKCPVCEGSGKVAHPLTGMLAAAVCQACEGKGIVWG